jgi:DNA-binding transcriptional MerR regulator
MSGPADTRDSYRIGEVGARTGIAPTALRYYEEVGVIPPAMRDASGYRRYDDRDVARLQLVARAKGLGASLDDIATLVSTWDGDGCAKVSAELRELIAGELAHADERIATERSRSRSLAAAAASLPSNPPHGPCTEACGCLGFDDVDDVPIACTLEPGSRVERVADWSAVLDHVAVREPRSTGLRLVFDSDAVLPEVARLATAERSCCGFFDFVITLDARGPALEVSAPPEAREIVDALFPADAGPHERAGPIAGSTPVVVPAGRVVAVTARSDIRGRARRRRGEARSDQVRS